MTALLDLFAMIETRGHMTALGEVLLQLKATSSQGSGCLQYSVAKAQTLVYRFYLNESWLDQAAVDEHEKVEHFLAAGKQMRAHVAKDVIHSMGWSE